MADKQISDLTSASQLTDGSLFVLEQAGAAMKANWGMMKNYISPGVAAQYSSSSTYAVGDYVIHNGTLYRCITAITTAESWTAAHWTAVALGDDVSNLKSALDFPYSALATNTDLDDITGNGLWWISSGNSYTNMPTGMTNGILITRLTHTTSTNIRFQLAYSNNDGKCYFRYRTANGYSAWGDNLDELRAFEKRIGALTCEWVRGRYTNTGAPTTSTDAIRSYSLISTNDCPSIRVFIDLIVPSTLNCYALSVCEYSTSSTSSFIKVTSGIKSGDSITFDSNTKYIGVVLRGDPVNTVTVPTTDGANVHIFCGGGELLSAVKMLEEKVESELSAIVPYGETYKQTSVSRSMTVTKGFVSGDHIAVKMTKWTGDTPTAINLYLSTDGTTFSNKSQVTSINQWLEFTADQNYVAFRVGVVATAPTDPVIMEFILTPYHETITPSDAVLNAPYIYGKSILLGGASIAQGFGGTGYAMDGDTVIDISDTTEGSYYHTAAYSGKNGLWKRNTSGYCWANLFESLLESKYGATVVNNGCQGTNINFWASHAADLIPSGYDLFIYSFSSNDRNITPSSNVKTKIRDGLRTLKNRCNELGTEIIAVSVPPASETNEAGKDVQTWQCNEFIKSACAELGVQYFDLHNELIKYYWDHGATSAGTYSDGLHPDDSMYYVMYFCYCWLLDISPTTAYAQPPASD